MAFFDSIINRDELPQGDDTFEPLPPGWYDAMIAKSETAPTKSGNGEILKIRFDIIGPTHQGRVVFGNLNVTNPSLTAEKIAREALRDIMSAVGITALREAEDLVNKTIGILLQIRTTDGYPPRNEVRGYRAVTSAMPASGLKTAFSSTQSVPVSTSSSSPPWATKK